MKTVLFIGPKYMDLYKDIIDGFTKIGYTVDFASELSSKKDPLNVRKGWFDYFSFGYDKVKEDYWIKVLNQKKYNKKYDILFVLNGQGLHRYIFETLRRRNKELKCYNYLFDTIKGVYKFNVFFPYFDKVYSFDKGECAIYDINWLPIYWVEQNEKCEEQYVLFGFGSYIPSRFTFYKSLFDFANKKSINCYIKLRCVIHREWLYKIVQLIGRPFGFNLYLSIEDYHSPLIVQSTMSPSEFRAMINRSKVIVDTHPEHQDGMTARFMWAMGAGKKIITTNVSIVDYDFYTPNSIFVIDKPLNEKIENSLWTFINEDSNANDIVRGIINKYKIDNWIKTIIN